MTEPQIDEPGNEQDRGDVVMAELVHPGGRWLARGIAAVLIGAFFIVDVVFQQKMHRLPASISLVAVLMGLCIGQVNLIAVWASLAPGNIVLRVAWSLLLTMAMWYGLILGSRPLLLSSYTDMTRSQAIVLLIVLLGSVAVLQVPLWIGKKVFRWRLTRQPGDTAAALQEDRQFNLQHLLIATVLLAMALSPLREVLPPGIVDFPEMHHTMWVLLAALTLCNLVITLPCIWWAFASKRRLIPLLLGWPFYCAVLTAIEFGCVCAILGRPGEGYGKIALSFYLINLSQCAAVLGTLWILRAIGFRMVRMPARRGC
jgi:hypothetical protein